MSRGFLCLLFRCTQAEHPLHQRTPPEVWRQCLKIAVRTFRYNNPGVPLLILDVHDQLTTGERTELSRLGGLLDSSWAAEHHFRGTLMDKLIALRASPFEESCLFDLDFLFTGRLGGIFDQVTADLGVLGYPNYRRTLNSINTGLTVLRRREAVDVLLQEADRAAEYLTDEDVVDRCLSQGTVSVTRLSDIYGKSKQLWTARSPQELNRACASSWTGPLRIEWVAPRPRFWLGDERVSAFHFSSAKEVMINDGLVRRYLRWIGGH